MIGRNIFANYLGTVLSVGLTFVITPFMIHRLGDSVYGIWISAHTLLFYLKFLDFGSYNALVKYVAHYSAQGKFEELSSLVTITLRFFFMAGLLALGASVIIAFLIPHLFQVDQKLTDTLQAVIILMGVEGFVLFPGFVLNGILEGSQRYDIMNAISAAHHVLASLGIIVLLSAGWGVVTLLSLEIAFSLGNVIFHAFVIRKYYGNISFFHKNENKVIKRQVLHYSFWSFLYDLMTEGGPELDKLVVPMFLAISMLTPYSIACSLAALLFYVANPVAHTFFPLSSALDAMEDHDRLEKLLTRGTKLIFAICLPFSIVIFSMGDAIIANWVGAEYAGAGHPIVQILLISYMTTVFFLVPLTILTGLNKLKEIFYITLLENVLAVILVCLTVGPFQLVGLAAGCAAANILVSFCCLLPFVCRYLRVPIAHLLKEAFAKPFLPAIPAILTAELFAQKLYPTNWTAIAVESGIVCTLYFSCFMIFSLSALEREELSFQFKKAFVFSR